MVLQKEIFKEFEDIVGIGNINDGEVIGASHYRGSTSTDRIRVAACPAARSCPVIRRHPARSTKQVYSGALVDW